MVHRIWTSCDWDQVTKWEISHHVLRSFWVYPNAGPIGNRMIPEGQEVKGEERAKRGREATGSAVAPKNSR